MKSPIGVLMCLVSLGFASPAGAAVHEYLNPNPGVGLSVSVTGCDAADLDPVPFNIGAVRFCPGELIDGATITIADDVNADVGGRLCQDFNGGGTCNGPNELASFCGSVTLTDLNLVDPLFPVFLFFQTAVGSVLDPPCKAATHGFVYVTIGE